MNKECNQYQRQHHEVPRIGFQRISCVIADKAPDCTEDRRIHCLDYSINSVLSAFSRAHGLDLGRQLGSLSNRFAIFCGREP